MKGGLGRPGSKGLIHSDQTEVSLQPVTQQSLVLSRWGQVQGTARWLPSTSCYKQGRCCCLFSSKIRRSLNSWVHSAAKCCWATCFLLGCPLSPSCPQGSNSVCLFAGCLCVSQPVVPLSTFPFPNTSRNVPVLELKPGTDKGWALSLHCNL